MVTVVCVQGISCDFKQFHIILNDRTIGSKIVSKGARDDSGLLPKLSMFITSYQVGKRSNNSFW